MPNGKARQTPPRRAHGVRPPSGGATTGSPPREGVTRRRASCGTPLRIFILHLFLFYDFLLFFIDQVSLIFFIQLSCVIQSTKVILEFPTKRFNFIFFI